MPKTDEGKLSELTADSSQTNADDESAQGTACCTRQSLAAEPVPEHCSISTHQHELNESECENFHQNGRH